MMLGFQIETFWCKWFLLL